MTNNSPNQPNHPPEKNGYNPITLDDVQKPGQSPRDFYSLELDPWVRWVAAPLLGFIYVYSQRIPGLAPLTLLVLLGCLFGRLENHPRQIVVVPLTLATIRLAFQMSSYFTLDRPGTGSHGVAALDFGLSWLPMFFSICLVYISKRESVTFKLILGGSCTILASGLIPGEGFLTIFFIVNHALFIAVVVGIFIDLKAYFSGEVHGSLRPAL
jgi:hypothetical protein